MKTLTIIFKDGKKRVIERVKDFDFYDNQIYVYYLNSVGFLIFSIFDLSDLELFALR